MTTDDAVVLVVDDLPPNLKLMDAVLSPRGFIVQTATTGEEALEQLATRAPRPRPPRHAHAGHRRLRDVPQDPGQPRHRVPPGGHGHRQR